MVKLRELFEDQVFPGSSGSPVFFRHSDGTYKLLWMISAAPISEQDYIINGESSGSENDKIAIKYLGLGLLFKLETIKTVFDLVQ